jgi:hypothetical protein
MPAFLAVEEAGWPDLCPRDSLRHGFTPYYGALGAGFPCHRFHLAADANSRTVKHDASVRIFQVNPNHGANMTRKEKTIWL